MSVTSELEFYLLGREDQRTGGHTMFDPPNSRDHLAYERGRKDEARPVTVHVAVVELPEGEDPMLFVSRDIDELHLDLRLAIEDLIINQVVPEHWPEVYAYATAHQGDDLQWGEWHEGLHELDGTPWVTIEKKEL